MTQHLYRLEIEEQGKPIARKGFKSKTENLSWLQAKRSVKDAASAIYDQMRAEDDYGAFTSVRLADVFARCNNTGETHLWITVFEGYTFSVYRQQDDGPSHDYTDQALF